MLVGPLYTDDDKAETVSGASEIIMILLSPKDYYAAKANLSLSKARRNEDTSAEVEAGTCKIEAKLK